MKEKIGLIVALIMIIGTCFGVFFYFEKEYAHAGDMMKAMEVIKKVGDRLDFKITEDRLTNVRKDIYEIEDRYCPDKSKPCTEKDMPELVRKRYRELKTEKEKLEKELKIFREEGAK
jgi:hypothetical protein